MYLRQPCSEQYHLRHVIAYIHQKTDLCMYISRYVSVYVLDTNAHILLRPSTTMTNHHRLIDIDLLRWTTFSNTHWIEYVRGVKTLNCAYRISIKHRFTVLFEQLIGRWNAQPESCILDDVHIVIYNMYIELVRCGFD